MAFAGGAQFVQYRKKDFDRRKDLQNLHRLADLAGSIGRTLIINDDISLALEVGAQGVHLGKEDGSPQKARLLLGPDAVIGATVHSLEELDAIREMPVDYIGVGPVFGTRSKNTSLPDLGLQHLVTICAASPFPVVGIGSIDANNVHQVIQAGAHGVAVLSAFCLAPDPEKFVQDFLHILA